MKSLKYAIFFIGIFFFFKVNVRATICNYNISGYEDDPINWTLDTSNGKAKIKKALASTLYDSSETLLNWDSDEYVYNTKQKTSGGVCPQYLIQSRGTYCIGILCNMTNRMFASDENSLSQILKHDMVQKNTDREVHVMQLANRIKNTSKGSTCKYKGDYNKSDWLFEANVPVDVTLQYNGNGELISLESTLNNKYVDYVIVSYSMYQEKILENTCNSSIAVCQNSINEHDLDSTYTFYLSGAYKKQESSYEKGNDRCISFTLDDDSEDKNGNKVTSSDNCGLYDNFWTDLENSAKSYKTCKDSGSNNCGNSMQKFNQNVTKMETFCKSIYQSMNYTDTCVKKCIKELDTNLANLKVENGIDIVDNNGNCGLSARLANWLLKIIKWMRYIVPILLIILSILDYIKAIAADSEEEVKKVTSKFVKRLIVSVIIFLLPLALEFLLKIFGIPVNDFCL